MAKTDSNIMKFAVTAFVLLGVLFGMQIMTFIFGNLGTASSSGIADIPGNVTNRTLTFINESVFTIPEASLANYSGGFSVTEAINGTNESVIPATFYTVNSALGSITNATVVTWLNVTLSYTLNAKTEAEVSIDATGNNSLIAIQTYTEQADTQFNTVAIAITLVILIIVFLLFWNIFIKSKKGKSSGGNFA